MGIKKARPAAVFVLRAWLTTADRLRFLSGSHPEVKRKRAKGVSGESHRGEQQQSFVPLARFSSDEAGKKRGATLGSEPRRPGNRRMPVGNVAHFSRVGSPGKKRETCGWLRLLEGGLIMANAELMLNVTLGESLEILRLVGGDIPANRFCILGHYGRVCQGCYFHPDVKHTPTLLPSLPFCQ